MDKGFTVELPPHGFVRYIDHLGSDTRIVESARVSYGEKSKGEAEDKKLINHLYRHRHTSPFESCNITFNIKMPVFVMRQFVRHRTLRLNEFSARYKELPDQFYLPKTWRAQQKEGNKQGSVEDPLLDQTYCTEVAEGIYHTCYEGYKKLIRAGVGKEQARVVIPVSVYTEIYVNADIHNLLGFIRLRSDSHAQKEIQDVSNAMREIAAKLFPWTFEAVSRYQFKVVDTKEK